jgi:cytidine deaminase
MMPKADTSELMFAAQKAATSSYSPYSKFRVGAAVLSGGKVFTGTNIENASYGLTICAERVAIFSAIASGNRSFDAIAIACVDATAADPINLKVPCGACRQVMQEFASPTAKVILEGTTPMALNDLLPIPFSFDDIKAQNR